eukprot:967-Heterococcus_DN1.PRE.1
MDDVSGGPCRVALNRVCDDIDGIIVTNIFGVACDVLWYEQWCQQHNKLLLFDNAATAIGYAADGRCIHDIGNGSIISLHETKPIGRGEGGAVIVDSEVQQHVMCAMNFGFSAATGVRLGHRGCSNWRMSDIAAAAICDHLDTVINDNWVQRCSNLARFAQQELQNRGLNAKLNIT